MQTYLLRRVLAVVPVMLVVATVTFVLIRLAPGDPASIIAGPDATPENVARRLVQEAPQLADAASIRSRSVVASASARPSCSTLDAQAEHGVVAPPGSGRIY